MLKWRQNSNPYAGSKVERRAGRIDYVSWPVHRQLKLDYQNTAQPIIPVCGLSHTAAPPPSLSCFTPCSATCWPD
jgi:hypothetical protein